MPRIIISILLGILSFQVTAQTVDGYIKDQNGPVSYATVHIKGGSYGVVSNVKGYYVAHLPEGTHTLVFESVGHKTIEKEVFVRGEVRLNVELEESEERLKIVVVGKEGEDPAYAIIRKAMKAVETYNTGLNTFQKGMYIKASLEIEDLSNPDTTTPDLNTRRNVNLIESSSEVYVLKPNMVKEVKHAYRDHAEQKKQTVSVSISVDEQGTEQVEVTNPFLFYTRYTDGEFDFHTNQVLVPKLSADPIISPVGRRALKAYRYQLIESFRDKTDGVMIYRIRVTPKSPVNTVEGEIYIRDKSFNIHSLDLTLKQIKLKYFNNFRIVQDYERYEDGGWIDISRQEFYYDANLPGSTTAFGHTTVYFNDFKPNVTLEKRFMRKGSVVFDPDSYKKTEEYWAGLRPVGLKKLEAKFVHVQDSIFNHHQSKEYIDQQDSIFNDLKIWNFILTGIQHKNTAKGMTWYAYPLVGQIRINTVDGYRHTLGGVVTKEWKNGKELLFEGSVSYGFLNKNIRGSTELRYMYDPFTFSRIRLKYSHIYTMINTNESIRGTFSPSNYADNTGYGIGYEREWFNGFLSKIYLDYNQFRPYTGKTIENFWERFPLFSQPQEFDPFEELVLDINTTITFGQRYEMRPDKKVILGSKYPILKIRYSKGIKPFFKSDVNYDMVNIRTDHQIRAGRFGITRFSAQVGRFINNREVRISNLRFFRGSDVYFFSNPLQTFQLIGPLSLRTSKAYLQGHYVHHFNGSLLGRMRFFNRHSIQLAGGASTLYLEETNMQHVESFAGLERPFRLWGQIFRFGAYYAAGTNNIDGFSQGVKFGIDFYNGFSGSWQY